MKIGSGMHRIYRAQMDITTEDWVDTCEWMAEEYEDDWPGLTIPIDVENAERFDIKYVSTSVILCYLHNMYGTRRNDYILFLNGVHRNKAICQTANAL